MDFKTKNKTVIGLTGGICSGKSAASEIFKELGAEVIDSDALSKKYYQLLQDKITAYFKTADRAQVSQKIFKDPLKKKWLQDALHPLIMKEGLEVISKTDKALVVFDIPLLFECGLDGSFDMTLCIYCDYDIRLKRALKRFAAEDFKLRDKNQIPLEVKAQNSDAVIFNNGKRKDLEIKISNFYKTLVRTKGT